MGNMVAQSEKINKVSKERKDRYGELFYKILVSVVKENQLICDCCGTSEFLKPFDPDCSYGFGIEHDTPDVSDLKYPFGFGIECSNCRHVGSIDNWINNKN